MQFFEKKGTIRKNRNCPSCQNSIHKIKKNIYHCKITTFFVPLIINNNFIYIYVCHQIMLLSNIYFGFVFLICQHIDTIYNCFFEFFNTNVFIMTLNNRGIHLKCFIYNVLEVPKKLNEKFKIIYFVDNFIQI